MKPPEHVLMVVWHDDVNGPPRANLSAVDDQRDVYLLAGHLIQACFEGGPFRGAWGIGADRLVDRQGHTTSSVECGGSWHVPSVAQCQTRTPSRPWRSYVTDDPQRLRSGSFRKPIKGAMCLKTFTKPE